MKYYEIPLRVNDILRGRQVNDEIELRKSIHQNIRLILKAYTLSYQFDPSFGSLLNKYRANTPPQGKSIKKWRDSVRENIQKNLKDMLQRYETRIKVTDVIININFEEKRNIEEIAEINVRISGRLTLGGRKTFHFPDSELMGEEQENVFPLII